LYSRPRNQWTVSWDAPTNTPKYGKTIEQVNKPGSISVTYSTHYIPYLNPNETALNNTPRKRTPILQPCQGCYLHTPYHRDVRPKCVIITITSFLHKFKIHKPTYKPPMALPQRFKHLRFPTLSLITLSTQAYNLFRHRTIHVALPTDTITPTSQLLSQLSNNSNMNPILKYYINNILQGSDEALDAIKRTASSFSQANDHSFMIYTDGSLAGLQILQCHMEFGFHETSLNINYSGYVFFNRHLPKQKDTPY
jgi:hypothetical protein